jgi:hypothetical protein
MSGKFGSMPRFTAFAVDINGTVLARYDLAATEEELAEQEARQYLGQRQVDRSLVARPSTRRADRKDGGSGSGQCLTLFPTR